LADYPSYRTSVAMSTRTAPLDSDTRPLTTRHWD
jgi:hypothetical protein